MNKELKRFDDEIVGQTLIEVYKYRIDNPKATMKDTCAALNLNYQTTLAWIKDGRLNSYLDEIHDVRSAVVQVMALNYLPEIVEAMAAIALGNKVMRGQNPQAAADFVLRVAQSGAKLEAPGDKRVLSQTNIYMPSMTKPGDEPEAHHQVIDIK